MLLEFKVAIRKKTRIDVVSVIIVWDQSLGMRHKWGCGKRGLRSKIWIEGKNPRMGLSRGL